MTRLEYYKQWAAEAYPGIEQCGVEFMGKFVFDSFTLQKAWQAVQFIGTVRPTTTMANGTLNKEEFSKDDPTTVIDRLRGCYPQTNQPYKTSPLHHEAAREIERLRKELKETGNVWDELAANYFKDTEGKL